MPNLCLKNWFRWRSTPLLTLALFFGLSASAEDSPQPPLPAVEAAPVPESVVRQRFLAAYHASQNDGAKAETVNMLRGLREKESLRLLTGMLGDSRDMVRIVACTVMANTADSDGFFVKPLIGALNDKAMAVRIGAAQALGNARVRGDAIRALTLLLMETTGRYKEDEPEPTLPLIHACDQALAKLALQKAKGADPRALSTFWMDYWKLHEEEIRAEDKKLVDNQPEPVRPDGLAPDTFDRQASAEKPSKIPNLDTLQPPVQGEVKK